MVNDYLEIDTLFIKPHEYLLLEEHEYNEELMGETSSLNRVRLTSDGAIIDEGFFTKIRSISKSTFFLNFYREVVIGGKGIEKIELQIKVSILFFDNL